MMTTIVNLVIIVFLTGKPSLYLALSEKNRIIFTMFNGRIGTITSISLITMKTLGEFVTGRSTLECMIADDRYLYWSEGVELYRKSITGQGSSENIYTHPVGHDSIFGLQVGSEGHRLLFHTIWGSMFYMTLSDMTSSGFSPTNVQKVNNTFSVSNMVDFAVARETLYAIGFQDEKAILRMMPDFVESDTYNSVILPDEDQWHAIAIFKEV